MTTIIIQKLKYPVSFTILGLFFLIGLFGCANDQISYQEGRYIKDWLICGSVSQL